VGTIEEAGGHPLDRHDKRSRLADQLLEPTKLVFAVRQETKTDTGSSA
jgi:hypothetical protein